MLLRWFIRKTTVAPRVDRREAGLVREAQAHPVEQARRRGATSQVAEPEVEVGVERRHDLAGVARDLRHRHLAGHPGRAGCSAAAASTCGS